MSRIKNNSKSNDYMTNAELKLYCYESCKSNLVEVMKDWDNFQAEFEMFELYGKSTSGIITFNGNNYWNSLSPQEKDLTKQESLYHLAELFYKKLEYLTSKVLNKNERAYFNYIFINKQKATTACEDLLISDYEERIVRQSTVFKACKLFHCLVRKDGKPVIYIEDLKKKV